MKRKILITVESDLYLRNFVKNGAFLELDKQFEVYYAFVKSDNQIKFNVNNTDNLQISLDRIRYISYSEKRARKLYNFTKLNMVKLRKKSPTFMTRFLYELSKKMRILYVVLSIEPFYTIYKYLFIKIIGKCESIEKVLNDINPELIISPTSLIDSVSIDIILSAKRKKIKTMILINGWDNISSKGTIPYLPDFLGVWGEQSKQHAVKIHDIPAERIVKLGAAQFDKFFFHENINKYDIKKSNNLPKNKKILLFAGSARVFDETALLLKIENAIESQILEDIHILYRPHPWRHRRLNEESFFNYNFKHVTMDILSIDVYKKSKENLEYYSVPGNFLPSLDYYPILYKTIDGVICTLTTVMVEAAIFGKPSLAIAFGDGKHKLTMDKLRDDMHFKEMFEIEGVLVSDLEEDFINNVQKLLNVIEDKKICSEISNSIEYILYSDDHSYAQRLADFVVNNIIKC